MAIPVIPIAVAIGGGGLATLAGVKIKGFYDGHYYHKDGYNNLGFDKRGYNREGYNEKGYDEDGYDRDGYNARGYDRDGYNSSGFDKRGFDRDGRDKNGFDRDGYDRSGRDRKGFDREGWNENMRDVTGHDPSYYAGCAAEIKSRIAKAEGFMDSREYEHVSVEIRKGAELAVKCVISHTRGVGKYSRHLEQDIDSCKDAIDDDMIDKMHSLRRICSDQLHIDEKNIDNLHNKLFFCVKTLEEMVPTIDRYASATQS